MIREVLVNGRPVAVPAEGTYSLVETEPGVYSVLVDGRSWEVFAENGVCVVDGERFTVEVVDPRAPNRKAGHASAEGRQTLLAAMPGKIVRVLVGQGDAVQAGQGIVVVEAMKMQNEVKSPKAGTVVRIAVGEGATVTAGEVLAVVE